MQERLRRPESQPGLSELVSAIIADVQRLLRQELALARLEVKSEWAKFKFNALWLLLSGLVGMASVVLVGLALAYFLSELTAAPLSASYFLVGVAFGVVGLLMYMIALKQMKRVRPIPDKTVDSLKESVQWIRKQV